MREILHDITIFQTQDKLYHPERKPEMEVYFIDMGGGFRRILHVTGRCFI